MEQELLHKFFFAQSNPLLFIPTELVSKILRHWKHYIIINAGNLEPTKDGCKAYDARPYKQEANVYCDDNMCYSTQMLLPFLGFHSATPPTLKCLIKVSIKQEAGGNGVDPPLRAKHA